MGRLALGRGLSEAGRLGIGFGQQMIQGKKDKKKEEEEARLRKISEDLAGERLLNVQEEREDRQVTREEKANDRVVAQRLKELVETPTGKRIIQEAFTQISGKNLGDVGGKPDPEPIMGEREREVPSGELPSRQEVLGKARLDYGIMSSQDPGVKGYVKGLETEETALKERFYDIKDKEAERTYGKEDREALMKQWYEKQDHLLENKRTLQREKAQEGINAAGFNKMERDEAHKFLARIDKDSTIKAINKSIGSALSVKRLIQSGSKLAPSVVEVQMPRVMEEVGNLAVQEQIKWRGSGAIVARIKRFSKKLINGKMTKEDENELTTLIDLFVGAAAERGIDRVGLMQEQSLLVSGISEERFGGISAAMTDRYQKHVIPTEPKGKTSTTVPTTIPTQTDEEVEQDLTNIPGEEPTQTTAQPIGRTKTGMIKMSDGSMITEKEARERGLVE